MSSYHAQLSPSSAHRWTDCTASVEAQRGLPNDTSAASRHGTCGHQLSAECLELGLEPQSYLGRVMGFPAAGREDWIDKFPDGTAFAYAETVTQDLIDACNKYVGFVRQLVETAGPEHTLIVEQQVPIGHITGEEGARGTSDCILISGGVMTVIDLKLGRSPVLAYEVMEPAAPDLLTGETKPPVLRMNLQPGLYGLGTYEKYGLLHDIERVKAIIVQPYLNKVSEYECSLEELLDLGDWLKARANETRTNPSFKPSSDNCFFCKARFTCHARNAAALAAAVEGFEDVEQARPKPVTLLTIGDCLQALAMVKSWVKDVEQKGLELLLAGAKVVSTSGVEFTLKQGRKPAAAWTDPAAVLRKLETMRLSRDVIFEQSLRSPTQLAKFADQPGKKSKAPKEGDPKKPIGKTQWSRIAELIDYGAPNPVIAPTTDPRPDYVIQTQGFDSVPPADNSDLF